MCCDQHQNSHPGQHPSRDPVTHSPPLTSHLTQPHLILPSQPQNSLSSNLINQATASKSKMSSSQPTTLPHHPAGPSHPAVHLPIYPPSSLTDADHNMEQHQDSSPPTPTNTPNSSAPTAEARKPSWTPNFERRQSWSAQDRKHQLHMETCDSVKTGPGFTERA